MNDYVESLLYQAEKYLDWQDNDPIHPRLFKFRMTMLVMEIMEHWED